MGLRDHRRGLITKSVAWFSKNNTGSWISQTCIPFFTAGVDFRKHGQRLIHVKGMYPAPDIHEHFTIHKWLRQTAYIFTHNFNNLEHIATDYMNAMTHTDVTTAHH